MLPVYFIKASNKINWRNGEERSAFENELKTYRKAMKIRSVWEKIKWFIGIFIIQFGVVILLYGPCAFFIVSMAEDKKQE